MWLEDNELKHRGLGAGILKPAVPHSPTHLRFVGTTIQAGPPLIFTRLEKLGRSLNNLIGRLGRFNRPTVRPRGLCMLLKICPSFRVHAESGVSYKVYDHDDSL